MDKKYATAKALRTALEERIKNHSRSTGMDIQRLRRQISFDRLLFRLFQFFSKDLLLKGGYAMELRLEEARVTKDIDLVLKTTRIGSTENQDHAMRKILQEAIQKDSGDFFIFLIGESTLDLEAVPYGGSRYPIDVMIDERLFVRFPIDVVVSSLFINPIEQIENKNFLEFAGIETMAYPAISAEQQFAEKIHAYTLPREESENSRVKDVIDMILLIKSGKLRAAILKTAIEEIFKYRGTHLPPTGLKEPPTDWEPKFNKLAQECHLTTSLSDAMVELVSYLRLPLYVKDDYAILTQSKAKCHFCGQEAKSEMVRIELFDTDCENCGAYRAIGSFFEFNNGENNSSNWNAWRKYLQGRPEKQKRIIITIKSVLPVLKIESN